MNKSTEDEAKILGKEKGRKVAPEGTDSIHRSNWMPKSHNGKSSVPYILHPKTIGHGENMAVREIWESGNYQGRDFATFSPKEAPSKYKLAQALACGLKATNATYSQHWQGMYLDWSMNQECRKIFETFQETPGGERFVNNAFATVVLVNTGYTGGFMDLMKNRRGPIPPSMGSLEHIDMGTFTWNLKAAAGAALGGQIGVNVIRRSLARDPL